MDPNTASKLNKASKKGILGFFRNKIFLIVFVIFLVALSAFLYLNTTTPGGFSPLKTFTGGSSEQKGPLLFSQETYLLVEGLFDKKTGGLILTKLKIENGKYIKNPKNKNLGYQYEDLSSRTQIKLGITYNDGADEEIYYMETASSSGNIIRFSLNFPPADQLTFYVEGAFGNIIAKRYLEIYK